MKLSNFQVILGLRKKIQEDYSGNWYCTNREPSEQREPKPNQIDKHPTYRIPQGPVFEN